MWHSGIVIGWRRNETKFKKSPDSLRGCFSLAGHFHAASPVPLPRFPCLSSLLFFLPLPPFFNFPPPSSIHLCSLSTTSIFAHLRSHLRFTHLRKGFDSLITTAANLTHSTIKSRLIPYHHHTQPRRPTVSNPLLVVRFIEKHFLDFDSDLYRV